MMDNKTIGYTTGVFDLFHIGHLNILKQAKAQCDYLIVGVSTDELVLDYKKKTPVIPFEERMEIVKAVRYVDQVVIQDNRDKLKAHEKYQFNKMFVGDDWKNNKMFSELEKKFEDRGVNIIYFPYTKHTSSTKLSEVLEKIVRD